MSATLRGAHGNFLKRAAIHSIRVFQVKGHAPGLSLRRNFHLERYFVGWTYVRNGHGAEARTVFVVEVSDQVSREEYAEGSGEFDLAVFQASSLQRTNQ